MDYCVFAALTFLLTAVCAQDSRSDLNEHCLTVGDCKSIGYFCARNRTCQCRPSYIASRNGDKCVGYVGERCKYDEHCIDGAYCDGNVRCQCKEFYYPSEDGRTCSSSDTQTLYQRLAIPLVMFTICSNMYFNT
ncbi:fibrillin-1-like [Cylas formicarius]|uniref:fibrillin-1-like n=1 Tax=Cylas formicarius TaxID=197179 RepID=UPI002958A864|nr:fibrillin-1-like [Cylas formicarius]XP_060525046.1 fibrillin-1-like [Cylas formicarius]